MSKPIPAGNPALLDRIRNEIRESGPMPFARFMELALHDPEHGYYSPGGDRLGKKGDFFTSSDVGTIFGSCVARQIGEMDVALGCPRPFTVMEFGAGRGLLAADILGSIDNDNHDLAGRLSYLMIDSSPGMRSQASLLVPEALAVAPDELQGGNTGCILAVELFDALPVHRVRRRDGKLIEVFVDVDDDGDLVETESSPSHDVAEMAGRYGAASREGTESELCPAYRKVLDLMDRTLDRGFIIMIDYGLRAHELYGPAYARGTLLAYHRHTTNEDYLRRVGEQDLTAHVNYSAIEDHARQLGWTMMGLTTQDRFLIGNGILEQFEARDESQWNDPAHVKGRLQAMQLIHPEGMGRTFSIMILSRGVEPVPDLAGLRDPFRRKV